MVLLIAVDQNGEEEDTDQEDRERDCEAGHIFKEEEWAFEEGT